MSLQALEERLAAVETKLEQRQREKEPKQEHGEKAKEPRGWQRIVGKFADNPLFEEAIRHGKEWRESEDIMDNEAIS